MDKKELLCSIPKVDELLSCGDLDELQKIVPRNVVTDSIREVLNDVRQDILSCDEGELESINLREDKIIERIKYCVQKVTEPHLKRVVNCTGIIIHTNLGRAVLCDDAVDAVVSVAGNYSNLEYDIDKGQRGSRYSHVEAIIKRITGAEAAIVVNNNAAAVLLVLSTLCKNREAVISRGELVEIGGSFRVPEVMEQSGAILKEIGATNRTHLNDYENAINDNTGVLLKVHTSNYRIMGFTESVKDSELCALGKKHGIPVVEDIGSGSFIDFSKYGLSYEPTVQEAVASGIDVITFSGDKMLGGPQAGIIVGRKEYIDKMKKNPLTRALRVDKMTLTALEATLKKYINEEEAVQTIPVLKMIAEPEYKIKKRAKVLLNKIKKAVGEKAQICILKENSQIGGGSMPLENLPTYAVSIKSECISTNRLEERLRMAPTPIITRMQNDSIMMDVRTIREEEYDLIAGSLDSIFGEAGI